MNARSTASSQTSDAETKSQRKRSRAEREKDRPSAGVDPMVQGDGTPDDAPTSKRKRDARSRPSADPQSSEDQTSTAQETEDISEEVQRRLRIKEERRRKNDNEKPEKRKRESLLSNGSTSPSTFRPKKKRVRSSQGLRQEQQIGMDGDSDHSRKQRKKTQRGT